MEQITVVIGDRWVKVRRLQQALKKRAAAQWWYQAWRRT